MSGDDRRPEVVADPTVIAVHAILASLEAEHGHFAVCLCCQQQEAEWDDRQRRQVVQERALVLGVACPECGAEPEAWCRPEVSGGRGFFAASADGGRYLGSVHPYREDLALGLLASRCPRCHAKPGERCRTSGGRVTYPHARRGRAVS